MITITEDEAEWLLDFLEVHGIQHDECRGNTCQGCWANSVEQGLSTTRIPECKPDCELQEMIERLDLLTSDKE